LAGLLLYSKSQIGFLFFPVGLPIQPGAVRTAVLLCQPDCFSPAADVLNAQNSDIWELLYYKAVPFRLSYQSIIPF